MIPEEIIQEILERTDIVQLVGGTVDLRKAGTVYKGLCPFHEEKTPSFIVTPVRRTYHCFGCQAHGHAIRWMMDHEGQSFPEAVRSLGAACGVEVPEARQESPEQRAARERKKSLTECLLAAQDKVAAFYTEALFGSDGGRARDYLESRGITRKAAEAFRLGWAGSDKTAFARFMDDSEVQRDDLQALGILLPPDEGWEPDRVLQGGYLRFRERLMFPIVDVRGEVTGFSGRILDPKAKAAKYVNSPETPVFTKGEQLYGAFTARHAARRAGRLVLVEGQVDVVMLWQAGLEGAAAAMGTALTPKQVRLVKRLGERVVCVMDGDAAGAKAAFASLLPFLDEGLQPRAVMLPQGEDPDSFVRACGVETFLKMVDQAPPLLDLFIDRAGTAHPNDPPGRAAALRELAPALVLLTDEVTAGLYRKKVCDVLDVEPEMVGAAIRGALEAPPARRRAAPSQEVLAGPAHEPVPPPPESFTGRPEFAAFDPPRGLDSVPSYERQAVEFIVQYPHLVERFYATQADNCLTHPGLAAFLGDLYREVCAGRTPNEDRILSQLDDSQVVAFIRDLQAKRPSVVDENVDRAFESALLRLRRGHLERRRDQLIAEGRTANQMGDRERVFAVFKEAAAITATITSLNRPDPEGAH